MNPAQSIAAIASRIAAIGDLLEPPATNAVRDPGAFTQTLRDVQAAVAQQAARAGVDPALALAVASSESGFNPRAVSAAGAQGVMQLMPQTAAALGVRDAFDPVENARGGAAYLRDLLGEFGDLRLAVAAYNAGPAAVRRFGGVPPYAETRAYVDRVLTSYHAYRSASSL